MTDKPKDKTRVIVYVILILWVITRVIKIISNEF